MRPLPILFSAILAGNSPNAQTGDIASRIEARLP